MYGLQEVKPQLHVIGELVANTNISQNFNIGAFKRLHEVQYVSNVTVGGTNISGENLLFVGIQRR